MSWLGALILSRFSKSEEAGGAWKPLTVGEAGDALAGVFSEIRDRAKGGIVVDFGSGHGQFSVALAKFGASHVFGIEIQQEFLAMSRELAKANGLADKITFAASLPPTAAAQGVDLVISHDSFEHFGEPLAILKEMRSFLRPGSGRILVSFGPPWYSPYGAHMHFFTRIPWVHLLFSENSVFRVRARFRSDGAARFEDVPGGLNRMSLSKFERLVRNSGLELVSRRYRCLKGMNFLASVPLLRELFVNHVTCELRCAS